MTYIPNISKKNYTYSLPEHCIAQEPLQERDASKLLVASRNKQTIENSTFRSIASFLPEHSLMIVNNTEVIHARLAMQKVTGGFVEIFVLQPANNRIPAQGLSDKQTSVWECMVGGKNIKRGMILSSIGSDVFEAIILHREKNYATVEFRFSEQYTFSHALQLYGNVPIPPYIRREAGENDDIRYQTVYAEHQGSVAAPTAGLHFTKRVFDDLQQKSISVESVTLHVGLGTFEPWQSESISDHSMHHERIVVTKSLLTQLHTFLISRDASQLCILVGTTSLRTIESLYWIGVKLLRNEYSPEEMLHLCAGENFSSTLINQWDCYRLSQEELPTAAEALDAILEFLIQSKSNFLSGVTQLLIAPGYVFKIADALITNFHQPDSTLLLLVAAFLSNQSFEQTNTVIRNDNFWEAVYSHALKNSYRFLSYGDSSLLLP